MKKLLALLLALITLAGQAQTTPATYPKDASTGLIAYEAIPVDGVSKADLFTRAKLWLASSFKSAKDVVQTEDKDAGIIIGKGYSVIAIQSGKFSVPAKLYYTLKLNFKDGKYKYEFTDFYFENEPIPQFSNRIIKTPVEERIFTEPKEDRGGKIVASYKQQFDQTTQALISSLKAGMSKSNDF